MTTTVGEAAADAPAASPVHGGARRDGGGGRAAHGVECVVDATVGLRDPARWSTTCRRGTAAFMLDTGDGTHLTFAFLMRGCDDTGFVLQSILDHIADIVTGDAVVPVKLGPWWGRRSRLLDPDSALQRVVLSVQAHLTAMGMAVDGSRPPHIEVVKH